MNREIKFRAHDKERNRVVDVAVIDFQGDANNDPYIIVTPDYVWNEDPITGEAECMIYLKNAELIQYTGINASDGTEIWEGDIFEDNWEVYWDTSGWYLRHHKEKRIIYIEEYGYYSIKVIGNKFENPELLKGEE